MAKGGTNPTGTVGPNKDIEDAVHNVTVSEFLLNPGLLQASYTITNGTMTGANTTADSKCSGCDWNTTNGAWGTCG